MRYNGLNNMFFPLCLINDNHSVTSPSHTKKTKSDNYSKHHKNTLIDNKALSLFKMDDHEKVIGLIQKMKRIYDSLPSGKITKETDRKIHKYFIDIASHANNKCDDRITRRVYLKEGANKQVISSQADSLIKISRIWADFFPANTS
ncbi:hypothetical protein ACRW6P_17375, partial [Escherichia coli]